MQTKNKQKIENEDPSDYDMFETSDAENVFRAESLLECEEYFEKESLANKQSLDQEVNGMDKFKQNPPSTGNDPTLSAPSGEIFFTETLEPKDSNSFVNRKESGCSPDQISSFQPHSGSEKISKTNQNNLQKTIPKSNQNSKVAPDDSFSEGELFFEDSSQFSDFSASFSTSQKLFDSTHHSSDSEFDTCAKKHKNSLSNISFQENSQLNNKVDYTQISSIAFMKDLILSIDDKNVDFKPEVFEEGEDFLNIRTSIHDSQNELDDYTLQNNFDKPNLSSSFYFGETDSKKIEFLKNKELNTGSLGSSHSTANHTPFMIQDTFINQYVDFDCGESVVESGFTTANKNKIFIDPGKLRESKMHFGLFSQNSDIFDLNNNLPATNQMIDSGFTTGDNKKIFIDKKDIPDFNNENFPDEINNKENVPLCDRYSVKSPLKNLAIGHKNKKIETTINFNFTNKFTSILESSKGFSKENDLAQLENESDFKDKNNGVVISKVNCNNSEKPCQDIENCNKNENINLNDSTELVDNPYSKNTNFSKINCKASRLDQNCIIEDGIDDYLHHKHKAMLLSKKLPAHQPMRRYNIPEKGHSSTAVKENLLLFETYEKVLKIFKKQEEEWVFTQFKWTWLHLFVKNNLKSDSLFEEVVEIMKLRLKYEHSVLRRIVEFDDIASKFLILGIISFDEKTIELFDGFYSIIGLIDKNIYDLLKKNNCTLGSKIFIYGSELLLKSPESIFDIHNKPVLKLQYNGVKTCSGDFKLGAAHKIAFLNTISSIIKDGGVISCLIVKIVRIIELKHLVAIESYRNRVDDLEKEIDKIMEIAEKTGHQVDMNSIRACQYAKVIVSDNTGECLFTWWQPPEIKVGEMYKFIYVTPVSSSIGMHITTSRRTYWEKI